MIVEHCELVYWPSSFPSGMPGRVKILVRFLLSLFLFAQQSIMSVWLSEKMESRSFYLYHITCLIEWWNFSASFFLLPVYYFHHSKVLAVLFEGVEVELKVSLFSGGGGFFRRATNFLYSSLGTKCGRKMTLGSRNLAAIGNERGASSFKKNKNKKIAS